MEHFQHSLVIEATPADIYAALATPAGLRGWWTRDCDGAAAIGGTLDFHFGATRKTMRIERLDPSREVRWLCTAAQMCCSLELARRDEWVGTRIVFRLAPLADGHTRLDFEHEGLTPALECHTLCSEGWRHFLDSLRQFASTGRGTPYEPEAAAAAQ